VFSRVGDELMPVVVLGFRDNLFVEADGRWERDAYIPASIRRYPFGAADVPGQYPVCIDTAYEGYDAGDGERLFDDEGKGTPYFNGVVEFLRGYQVQVQQTRVFVKRLQDLQLFRAVDANIRQLQGGQAVTIRDLAMVNEESLRSLPDDVLASLVRDGSLGLIYTHLLSLGNFNGIMSRSDRNGAAVETQPARPVH
jgi:hypothetical protein